MGSFWLLYVATLFSLINAYVHNIIAFVFSITHKQSKHCKTLRQEIIGIKREMDQFSMVDEFARHARLQRKLIKLQQEWKAEANINNSSKLQAKFIGTTAARIILGLFTIYLLYQYRFEPVIEFPSEWFSPVISTVLSWPTGKEGAVSLISWLLISGSVTKRLATFVC